MKGEKLMADHGTGCPARDDGWHLYEPTGTSITERETGVVVGIYRCVCGDTYYYRPEPGDENPPHQIRPPKPPSGPMPIGVLKGLFQKR